MYVHTLYSVVAVLRLCKLSRQSSCTNAYTYFDYRIFLFLEIKLALLLMNETLFFPYVVPHCWTAVVDLQQSQHWQWIQLRYARFALYPVNVTRNVITTNTMANSEKFNFGCSEKTEGASFWVFLIYN